MLNRKKQLGLVFMLTLFAASFAVAQNPTPTPKITEEEGVIKVDSRLIVVPVSVTNANGEPVIGLTAKDFTIQEEGKVQVIDSLANADSVPLEIALLFDISATTSPMFRFQQETAAMFLRDVMRPIDRATIFTVGAKPTLIEARGTAEKAISAVTSIVPTKEFTAFFDSVGLSAEFLKTNAPEGTRRVIVVISDGEDTNSERISKAIQNGYRKIGEKINTLNRTELHEFTINTRNEASSAERKRVSKLLQDADTVFYSINPAGSSFLLNKMSVFGQENMQLFSKDTGGTAFLPKFGPIDTKDQYQNQINMRKNSEMLQQIFRQLANELRAQYLIQYYAETDHPDNKFVRVNVALPSRGDLKVRAREGYYAKN